jgi:folate-binding Fe-S cluster repair protein YgfZ
MGSGLASPGYTLILPASEKEKLWQVITGLGAIEMSDRAWDTLRILQGRPAPDLELTDDYNPLELPFLSNICHTSG